jgi:hypothetical protein
VKSGSTAERFTRIRVMILKGGNHMRLSPPTKIVFYISVVLFLIGVIANFVNLSFLTMLSFWFLVIAYVLLALGNMMTGL